MTRLLLIVLLLAAPLHVAAQPKPIAVPVGSASFSPQGQPLTITSTPTSVIQWQSFNIQSGATRFNQQPPASAVINRVQAANPAAQIQGVLQQPDGKVQLVSPAGPVLPPEAGVSVSGLGAQSQMAPFTQMRSATEAVRTPDGKIVLRATPQ
jgi:filamentous hemagglutinin family protein